MRHRFVYTRHGGGVSITVPSVLAVWHLRHGGRWPEASKSWLEAQIERHVRDGINEETAARYVHAMHRGGCSENEALWLVGERDCRRFGTALELWDVSEIPTDRTYRNAWKRSQNGGPIMIDERLARAIDEERMWRAYDAAKG